MEICLNGVWGSVCDDGWDAIDASVVCQQLGYDGGKFISLGTFILLLECLLQFQFLSKDILFYLK